jgi:hypothetical protein
MYAVPALSSTMLVGSVSSPPSPVSLITQLLVKDRLAVWTLLVHALQDEDDSIRDVAAMIVSRVAWSPFNVHPSRASELCVDVIASEHAVDFMAAFSTLFSLVRGLRSLDDVFGIKMVAST